RSETRSYAKGVKAGNSDQQLSPEERQAIVFAMRSDVDVAPAAASAPAPAPGPVAAVGVGDTAAPEQER
ncbi:MAG TPA: hypothetical protein VF218_09200, partial [Acidothermaceae bacterium]